MKDVLDVIVRERERQDKRWGEQNHDPFLWMTILGEEYGEACKAALESRFGGGHERENGPEEYREELIQVAAVAIAAIECLDRGKWKWSA